jgi:hypothetical protein
MGGRSEIPNRRKEKVRMRNGAYGIIRWMLSRALHVSHRSPIGTMQAPMESIAIPVIRDIVE